MNYRNKNDYFRVPSEISPLKSAPSAKKNCGQDNERNYSNFLWFHIFFISNTKSYTWDVYYIHLTYFFFSNVEFSFTTISHFLLRTCLKLHISNYLPEVFRCSNVLPLSFYLLLWISSFCPYFFSKSRSSAAS